MKLKEAMPIYRGYRQRLTEQTKSLVQRRNEADKKYKATGDKAYSDEAASLQLSIDAVKKEFDDNQKVLDGLMTQWCDAANAESAKAMADPETGIAATMGKIMTTVARMCAGDKVPYSDEKKVMEYDKDLYASAKQAQTMMAAMKKRQKEYDSLWDEEKGGTYDPEGVADNTEAQGDLPEVLEASTVDTASETEKTG